MKLKICKSCGGLYETMTSAEICPKCIINHEASFQKVKEYLREYPGTAMPILSEETGVAIPIIEQYLRQERIEISPDSPVMLACCGCGTEIVTGAYCENCRRTLTGQLQKIKNTIINGEKEEPGEMAGKMRYVPAKWRTK